MTEEKQIFLEQLFNDYSDRIYKTAYRKTRNSEIASDTLYETFLVAAEKVDILYNHPNKLGWLYSTLNNKLHEAYRVKYIVDKKSGKKYPIRFETLESEGGEYKQIEYTDNMYENILEDESLEKYKEVLKEREIKYITYKFKDGISIKEIAEKMNMSYSNATSTWSNIKKKIKKFLLKKKEN